MIYIAVVKSPTQIITLNDRISTRTSQDKIATTNQIDGQTNLQSGLWLLNAFLSPGGKSRRRRRQFNIFLRRVRL